MRRRGPDPTLCALALLCAPLITINVSAQLNELARVHDAGGGYVTGSGLKSNVSLAQGQPIGLSANSHFVNYAGFIRPTGTRSRQFIDFPPIGNQTTTDTVALWAQASSGLKVSFFVDFGPAIISSGTNLTFTGSGEVSVVATQPGDSNWNPAPDVTNTFNVSKAAQAALAFSPSTPQIFNTTNRLQVSGGSGTGVVGFAVISGPAQIVGGDMLWMLSGTGVVQVMASKAEDDLYLSAATTNIVTAAKADQAIAFDLMPHAISTDTIPLIASASSGLEVSFEVVAGPGVIHNQANLVFSGGGTVAVAAMQAGDSNWNSAPVVTNIISVAEVFRLEVFSAHGSAEPAIGVHFYVDGSVVTNRLLGPTVLGDAGTQFVARGWSMIGNSPWSGSGTSFVMTITNNANLTWLWATNFWLSVEAGPHGSASGSDWYELGRQVTITAVPEIGHPFTGWEGDVPLGQRMSNPLTLTMDRPRSVRATFHTKYHVDAAAGNDANSGLTWSSAKQSIAAALVNAFAGDSVVVSNGVYGPIVVPEGVDVMSVNGPHETVIDAKGTGQRAVQLNADSSLTGFTVTGADVVWDGAGVFAELGAITERCIIRDNATVGTGGGVFGGSLINSLVYSNSAQDGAGAANARILFSTIVRNQSPEGAGGVFLSEISNSIVYDNTPVNHGASVASYACTTPIMPGTGNFTNAPLFVDGEAGNFRLSFESPCIDAGSGGVADDLDGTPRPQPRTFGSVAGYDLGCYEYYPKARFVWAGGNGVPPYETWQDAAPTIQEALDYSSDGDRIVVEAGIYEPIVVSNAVELLSLRGPPQTVIDGGGTSRAVTVSSGARLDGFTLRHGVADHCGGILAENGARLSNLIIHHNQATAFDGTGGGVCLLNASEAENIVVVSNQARFGAGVYAASTSLVSRSRIEWNQSTLGNGGGVYFLDESTLRDSSVAHNVALSGGGVYAENSYVIRSIITDNTADETGGGALADNSEISNNWIQRNAALNGGGLFILGDCFIHSNVITDNGAQSRGGGAYVNTDRGLTANLTVADNVANAGGGGMWFNQAGHQVLNCIVVSNMANNVAPTGVADIRFSCISPLQTGAGNIDQSPLFSGHGEYHLKAASPCINAGTNQPWMAMATDIDGQPRAWIELRSEGEEIVFLTDRVDMGADEAVVEAASMRRGGTPAIHWNVVIDAELQLLSTGSLLAPQWTEVGGPFRATNDIMATPFDPEDAMRYYRLDWLK